MEVLFYRQIGKKHSFYNYFQTIFFLLPIKIERNIGNSWIQSAFQFRNIVNTNTRVNIYKLKYFPLWLREALDFESVLLLYLSMYIYIYFTYALTRYFLFSFTNSDVSSSQVNFFKMLDEKIENVSISQYITKKGF